MLNWSLLILLAELLPLPASLQLLHNLGKEKSITCHYAPFKSNPKVFAFHCLHSASTREFGLFR
jgi:hypothetical protein